MEAYEREEDQDKEDFLWEIQEILETRVQETGERSMRAYQRSCRWRRRPGCRARRGCNGRTQRPKGNKPRTGKPGGYEAKWRQERLERLQAVRAGADETLAEGRFPSKSQRKAIRKRERKVRQRQRKTKPVASPSYWGKKVCPHKDAKYLCMSYYQGICEKLSWLSCTYEGAA